MAELAAVDPKLVELDEHLAEVAKALQSAVTYGMAHRDQPEAVEKTTLDCKDLLDQVMDAKILDW